MREQVVTFEIGEARDTTEPPSQQSKTIPTSRKTSSPPSDATVLHRRMNTVEMRQPRESLGIGTQTVLYCVCAKARCKSWMRLEHDLLGRRRHRFAYEGDSHGLM